MTPQPADAVLRADVRALFDSRPGGVLIAAEPFHGILTCTLPGAVGGNGERFEPLLVKVPTSHDAAHAVHHEARLLVELRRMRLGPIERTIPRHVGMRSFDGLAVALSSTVPGRPMACEYRRWLHTAQPWLVRRDFQYAGAWLAALQDASSTGPSPSTWVGDVTGAVRDRWHGNPLLAAALSRLEPAVERLDGRPVDRTVVHGDFSHRNVLVDADRATVTGVVNWTAGELEGSPLRDLARFALRYPLGTGLVLLGKGWYPHTVRSFLRAGLDRLGVPADLWFDLVTAGIAEIAAQDLDQHAAEDHLATLASLPTPSRSRTAAGWR